MIHKNEAVGEISFKILILFFTVLLFPAHTLSQTKNQDQKIVADSLPEILLTSPILEQTDQESIALKIQIKDSDGIQDYWLTVSGLKLPSPTSGDDIKIAGQLEIRFSVDIPLVIGPNLVSIHAVDQLGHRSDKEIRFQRWKDEKGPLIHTLRRSLYFILKRIMQIF